MILLIDSTQLLIYTKPIANKQLARTCPIRAPGKGGEMMGMRRFAYGYEGPKDERSVAAAKEIAELMARKGFSYAEVDAILEQAQWILLQEYVPARPLSYAERDS